MLNIDGTLKNIYRTDRLPASFETSHKTLTLYFPDLDLTITNNRIVSESFSLTESICSSDDLEFGSCEASQVKLTVANLEQDLSGYEFVLTQIVNDTYTMPLGIYKVYSCKKQDAQWFREIVAYDRMKETDIDVAEWYNDLFQNGNETYTLKQFRENLLDYIGIEYEDENLPNDSMIVEKTVDVGQLSAREVLRCCVELQGAFGQINRLGKFCHKVLQPAYGLYPTEDLYPAEDLYPVAENDTSYSMPPDETITNSMMGANGVRYEEYAVKEIDKVIIRSEEDDIGAIVGTGSNAYIIQGNFLVFGKSAAELEQIARNAYGNMAKRPYRPYRAEIIGLPYIEQGDCLEFSTGSVRGYVLQRTLKGIQALMDDIEASGSEEREQNFGVNEEIIQLQGKVTRIKKDVEGVLVEVEDVAQDLYAGMSILAGQVVLKVDASGNVAAVELGADPSQGTNIKIKADNIQLEGLVTANGNFKVLPDGSIEAVNGKFSGDITGSIISGSMFVSVGPLYSTTIGGGYIDTNCIIMYYPDTTISSTFYPGSASFQSGSNSTNVDASGIITPSIVCDSINAGTPITSLNIGSQSVAFANSANSATHANYAINADYSTYAGGAGSLLFTLYTNQIVASDTGYGNIDFLGFDNAAGVNWVQANFQPKTTSDIRLKYNMFPLDDIPDELFYSLKPYQFKFKPEANYGDKIHFGLIAQQVESAFEAYGLNPYEYDLIEVVDVRKYTDDGYYVSDKTHRINDKNFVAWMINILKKQKDEIDNLKRSLKSLEKC